MAARRERCREPGSSHGRPRRAHRQRSLAQPASGRYRGRPCLAPVSPHWIPCGCVGFGRPDRQGGPGSSLPRRDASSATLTLGSPDAEPPCRPPPLRTTAGCLRAGLCRVGTSWWRVETRSDSRQSSRRDRARAGTRGGRGAVDEGDRSRWVGRWARHAAFGRAEGAHGRGRSPSSRPRNPRCLGSQRRFRRTLRRSAARRGSTSGKSDTPTGRRGSVRGWRGSRWSALHDGAGCRACAPDPG